MTAQRATPSDRSTVLADIVEGHHANARRALPYIVTLLARVAGFHGKRNGKLNALCEAGHRLADALEAHLDQQELQLFPALAAGEGEGVRRQLERTYNHHREMEQLLSQIRSLADGFVAPEWGDNGYRALMEELEAFEGDVLQHLRLERGVLPGLLARQPEAC